LADIRTWNSLGRLLTRKEQGILILALMVGMVARARTKSRTTSIPTTQPANEKPEPQLIGFRAVCVFDISQTKERSCPH
jgi:hypothetical protein